MRQLLRETFLGDGEGLSKLVAKLEELAELPREAWGIGLLRELADELLACEARRQASPRHEIRWLNLMGYAMRPGFGDPADTVRMREIWKLYFDGPCNPGDAQALTEWWIFWRRVASGLKPGHQQTIA